MKDEEILALITLRQRTKLHPEKTDVLCGKDRKCLNHAGSVFYKDKIDEFAEEYLDTAHSRAQKMAIVNRCIEFFLLDEGRDFFKVSHSAASGWEIVDIRNVRDKVGHAIRFTAQKIKKRREKEEAAVARSAGTAARLNGSWSPSSSSSVNDSSSLDLPSVTLSSSISSSDYQVGSSSNITNNIINNILNCSNGIGNSVSPTACVSQQSNLSKSLMDNMRASDPSMAKGKGKPQEIIQHQPNQVKLDLDQGEELNLDHKVWQLEVEEQPFSSQFPLHQLQACDDSSLLRYIDNYEIGQAW